MPSIVATSSPGPASHDLVLRHLPKSIATAKGHLRGQQQNMRSTKTIAPLLTMRDSLDFSPSQEVGNLKTNEFFASVIDNKPFRRSYSDQTGRFPIPSSCGNNYVFIMYIYDANAIMSVALPDRRGSSIRNAWLTIYQKLQFNVYAPKLHILDNQCSTDIKDAFKRHNVEFQRIPPHQHRRNAAERAIQTWKAHFIAGLSTWDKLLHQCDLTLGPFCQSLFFALLFGVALILGA